MPKVILHVGLPKTGSTALQKTLLACTPQLKKAGVLYPKHDLHKQDFLVTYLYRKVPATQMGRFILREADTWEARREIYHLLRGDPGYRQEVKRSVQARAAELWGQLVDKGGAECVQKIVLSDELLANAPDTEETRAHVRVSMAELSDDITVVAYLRSPVPRFLSGAGQKLKTLQGVPRIGEKSYAYKATLERLNALGLGPLKLHVYGRETLVNGDIIADFQHHYLPEITETLNADLSGETNENISAEAMVIFQSLLSAVQSKKTSKMHHLRSANPTQSKRVKKEIFRIDQAVDGFTKPALREEAVTRIIDAQAADLLWLRDTHGIAFSDVDYDRLSPDMPNDPASLIRVQDFCVVDSDRLEEMLQELFAALPKLEKVLR